MNRKFHLGNQPWKLDYDWKKQTMYFINEVSGYKKRYNIYDLWAHKTIGRKIIDFKFDQHEIPIHF